MSSAGKICGIRWLVKDNGRELQFGMKVRKKGSRQYEVQWQSVPEVSHVHQLADSLFTPSVDSAIEEAPQETVSVVSSVDIDPEFTRIFLPDEFDSTEKFEPFVEPEETLQIGPGVQVTPEPVPEPVPVAVVQPAPKVEKIPELTPVEKVKVEKIWRLLPPEAKIEIKSTHGTVAAWFHKTKGKLPEKLRNEIAAKAATQQASSEESEAGRAYGEDHRDQIAFRNQAPEDQVAILTRWSDSYAWYLCEFTNTIAVGLRENMDASQLARHYRLTLEEVHRCKQIKQDFLGSK